MADDNPTPNNLTTRLKQLLRGTVGGRYSQGAWVLSTSGYLAALFLLFLPLATYLWTSPQPLRDLYTVVAIAGLSLGGIGLVITYAKRLQDQNLNGLWALALLIALPWALLSATQAWINRLYKTNSLVDSGAYLSFAMTGWLVIVLVVALLPSRRAERFGPQTTASDVLRPRHPSAMLTLAVLALIVPMSIYAGFLQSGLWIGRDQYSYFVSPVVSAPGGGTAFATCGNAKGVSASAEEGQDGGFVRDAVRGTWSVVVHDNGTLDIQTFSERQVLSYQADGFAVRAEGLKLTPYGFVSSDVDHFLIIAEAGNDDVRNVTTLSFVKRDLGYYALISSSRVFRKGGLLAMEHPRAANYLLMADCTVSQEAGS